jgi:hypothetical protein
MMPIIFIALLEWNIGLIEFLNKLRNIQTFFIQGYKLSSESKLLRKYQGSYLRKKSSAQKIWKKSGRTVLSKGCGNT